MFPIRRAALRFLSTPSVSFASRSRTFASLTTSPLRVQKQTSSPLFQRRWASHETEKGDVPISQLQPTPQEEVENAISEDNAARTVDSATESPSDGMQPPSGDKETGQLLKDFPSTGGHSASQESAVNAAQDSTRSFEGSSARGARSRAPRTSGLEADGRNTPKPTVYIGNLFFDVTEDDLTKEVARFGKIEKVRLIRDARGLSKGYGYVTFSTTEEATKAITNLNQQLFEGRRLTAAYATVNTPETLRRRPTERSLNPPSKTLFIGNMSWEMTDKDLNSLFRGIKNIIDVRVAVDRRTGQPRGFAHADFTDVKSAMEGFKQLDGVDTHGRKLRVDYSYGPGHAPKNEAKDRGEL